MGKEPLAQRRRWFAGDKKQTKPQFTLKKLGLNKISGIEEVSVFPNRGTAIYLHNPTVQVSPAASTFTITGYGETEQVTETLPRILNHRGAVGLTSLRSGSDRALPMQPVAGKAALATEEGEDEVPDVVENFDAAEETTGSCYFILGLLFKTLFMDLIRSRSLACLSPSPLGPGFAVFA